jgi:hypothetical protein
VFEVLGTGQLAVTNALTQYTLVPGLTQTVTVPAGAKVHVTTSGGVQCTATGSAYAVVDLALLVDGDFATAAQRRVVAANTAALGQMISSWSFARTWTLSPGQHTFEVRAVSVDPSAATANVSSASAEQLRGVLTVMVIKQ